MIRLLLLFFAVATHYLATARNLDKPNVLLICVDDLNTQVGSYGNPVVKTPHIDRLAKMGIRFDRAYCNYPICNPSRTSMLSGRYPENTGVTANKTPPRSNVSNLVFLPEVFKQNGYFTAGIGKIFHRGFGDTVDWDEAFKPQVDDEDDDQDSGGGDRKERKRSPDQPRLPKASKGQAGDVPFPWNATENSDEEEPDGQVALRAVKILEQRHDKPFFLAVGFHKPHIGHIAPKKYFDLYKPEQFALRPEPPIASQNIPPLANAPKFYPDLSEQQRREIMWHYAAATTFMDAQLGKVLDAMDRFKLWENTIVVFWSDHGWHWGEHGGMWAKVSLMAECARIPFIIAAPGKRKNAACARVVESVDIFPTLAEFCGLPLPPKLDGKSLLPLLENPGRHWDGSAYVVVNRRRGFGRSLQTEQWTYMEWPDGTRQLYDAKKDPREFTNLATVPSHRATVEKMKSLMTTKAPSAASQ